MSEDTLFADSSDLQTAVGRAVQEKKALLCFVADESQASTSWEAAIKADDIRNNLNQTTIALRLTAGSDQAAFLNAVCSVRTAPAIVIIFNAQVVADYQHDTTNIDQIKTWLTERYGAKEQSEIDAPEDNSPKSTVRKYLELAPSAGKMRLPNNAYDNLRDITQRYMSSKVTGRALLEYQLRYLESLKIDLVNQTVSELRKGADSGNEPVLPDAVVTKLLNTSASVTRNVSAHLNPESSGQQPRLPTSAAPEQAGTSTSSQSQRNPQSTPPPAASSSSSIQAQQHREYMESRKKAEAERARIKAQIEADKKARFLSEQKARQEAEAERRRTELLELRKANSTTADPKASDIRIQVRMFDGSTIRSSFPAEASITADIRPWIDRETVKAENGAHQPYNLKLIMAPLPNRNIEAGEENSPLADLEGIRGSATIVMVPVKDFTNSYASSAPGIGGTVAGGVQSVVGTGMGLLNTAAGAAFGALGRLVGATSPSSQATSGSSTRPEREPRSNVVDASNVRVRTLADQRQAERDEQRSRGGQLYNGMGLNVQPRKDDEQKRD